MIPSPQLPPEEERIRENRAHEVFNIFNGLRGKKYQLVKRLDSDGCFSSIYLLREGGKELVMKAVDTMHTAVNALPQQIIRYTENEIKSMQDCKDCEYVMDLIDWYDYAYNDIIGDHVYLLIMPRLETCEAYFEACDYSIVDIIKMAEDICKALDYCHKRKILHRDVKYQNAYYDPEHMHFVLSDFGICRSMFDKNAAVTRIGSLIAPELYFGRPLEGRFNSDIYSLGMTMLVLNARMCMNELMIVTSKARMHTKISRIINKSIEGDPTKRYQTAAEFSDDLIKAEKIAKASEINRPQIEDCVEAFMKGDFQRALDIARAGCHQTKDRRMIYLCSYLLVCGKKPEEGRKLLLPLLVLQDPVATGLFCYYGHIKALEEKNTEEDRKMIEGLDQSAKNSFCIAQYLIGRMYLNGQFGFPKDVKLATALLFDSALQGFRPAMYYFKEQIESNKIESVVSFQPFLDSIEIELKNFSKEDFPKDVVRALANC